MRVLARYMGPNGEISIVEDVATGARTYCEGGAYQSYVLPGGRPGLAYVRLMSALLGASLDVLLIGCGGGALGTDLYHSGHAVTVVDSNPLSFQVAHRFFWMPTGVRCVVADLGTHLAADATMRSAIGVDVGGPHFDYGAVLDAATCRRLMERLEPQGRLAINIACTSSDDPDPSAVAARLMAPGRHLWVFDEPAVPNRNVVLLVSGGHETREALSALLEPGWTVRQHAGPALAAAPA